LALATALKRLLDLVLALAQILLAGFLNVERDQHFVIPRLPVPLYARILQSGAVDFIMNLGRIGCVCVLHINQRAAAEVNAQRDACARRPWKAARPR
jgi:hypothetical protein